MSCLALPARKRSPRRLIEPDGPAQIEKHLDLLSILDRLIGRQAGNQLMRSKGQCGQQFGAVELEPAHLGDHLRRDEADSAEPSACRSRDRPRAAHPGRRASSFPPSPAAGFRAGRPRERHFGGERNDLDRVAVALDLARQDVHGRRAHKRRDETIGGMLVNRSRRPALKHPAAFEDDDLFAHQQGFGLVVRHMDQRRAEAPMQVDHLFAQARAQRRVETRERLVEQDHARLARQRPADRDALALAAGERSGRRVKTWSSPSMPATVLTLVHVIRARRRGLQPEGKVVEDRQVRIKRRVLKDHGDVTPVRCDAGHVLPVKPDTPRVGESSPAINRNNVLLPDPDGPSTTNNSPRLIVRSIG